MSAALHINRKGRDWRPIIYNSLVVVRMGGRTAVRPYNPVLVGWVDARQCVLTILFWLDGWTHSSASLQSYHPTILFLLNWWTHSSASLPFHDFTIQRFPPSSSYHPDEFDL